MVARNLPGTTSILCMGLLRRELFPHMVRLMREMGRFMGAAPQVRVWRTLPGLTHPHFFSNASMSCLCPGTHSRPHHHHRLLLFCGHTCPPTGPRLQQRTMLPPNTLTHTYLCPHLPLQDLVFMPNATTGLNTAIQGAGLGPGDTLFMLDIGWVGG